MYNLYEAARKKKVKPIPDGYHAVTPYLACGDAARAIEFYKKAFGAAEVIRIPGPNGTIGHAEVKIGDSRVMLTDEYREMDFLSPLTRGGTTVHIHLYVADADKMAERRGVKIRTMSFANWDAEVLRTLEVYNDAWEKNWGFVPVGEKEYLHIAKDLKMVLHPDFAILAEVDGQPAAFVLTIQNVNPVLKKLDGKLFPFGVLRLIWDLKIRPKVTSGRLILLGIKAKYRGH
jgi:hypothetical protein